MADLLRDPAVRATLRAAAIVEVATRSAAGRPFLTPLWFVVDDGAILLTTGAGSWAGRNVAHDPRVALLFRSPHGALRLRGTARCHPGLPGWRALLRIAAKYYLPPAALAVELRHAARWRLRHRYYAQARGGPGFIRVEPTAIEWLPRPDGAG